MDRITAPTGEVFLTGTLGEIYPMCFERQKGDADRFTCLREPSKCPHNSMCFIAMQRAIEALFDANPDVSGGQFTFSTDKAKYMTKVNAATMLHTLYEIKEDGYSPVGQGE